jgi:hypothetical protein
MSILNATDQTFSARYWRLLEPFFLFSAHRFFIMSDNRFLPAGVRWSRFFLVRVARWETAILICGSWRLTFQYCYGLTEPVSFSLQLRYDSSRIQDASSDSLQDCEFASADSLAEKAQHHLTSGLVLRWLAYAWAE